MLDIWSQLDAFHAPVPDAEKVAAPQPANIMTFFSPGDDAHGALHFLLTLPNMVACYISMYGEDDPVLTQDILDRAVDPATYVQVNLDKTQAAGSSEASLVIKLREAPATRCAVGTSINGKINHLKLGVIIIKDPVTGITTMIRFGGSMNWSPDGEGEGGRGQNNELTLICDDYICWMAIRKLNADHATMLAQEAKRNAAIAEAGALAASAQGAKPR